MSHRERSSLSATAELAGRSSQTVGYSNIISMIVLAERSTLTLFTIWVGSLGAAISRLRRWRSHH